MLTWESGPNAGRSIEVKAWTQATGQIELFLPMGYAIESGDLFRIHPGCDKRLDTCSDRFANVLNFRGEPYVPGQDAMMSYPDARCALAIVAAARSWLGVPWRHQGRSRQGVDCAGLVVLVGRRLGLADYDTQAYGRRPEGQGFVTHFRAAMDGLPLPEAGPGDVLVFADAAYPCHCGFLTAKHGVPHLLHAHALRRKVIEEPHAGEWPLKVKLAFRFRGHVV